MKAEGTDADTSEWGTRSRVVGTPAPTGARTVACGMIVMCGRPFRGPRPRDGSGNGQNLLVSAVVTSLDPCAVACKVAH